jgi:hypothetical protein
MKGERWRLVDGSQIIITWDLPDGFLRVLNEHGKVEVIHENYLKERSPDGVA